MLEQFSDYLSALWQWLVLNRDWLFSGLVLTIVVVCANIIKNRLQRRRLKEQREALRKGRKLPERPTILKPDHEDRLKYDPEYRKLHRKMHYDHMVERYEPPSEKKRMIKVKSGGLFTVLLFFAILLIVLSIL